MMIVDGINEWRKAVTLPLISAPKWSQDWEAERAKVEHTLAHLRGEAKTIRQLELAITFSLPAQDLSLITSAAPKGWSSKEITNVFQEFY